MADEPLDRKVEERIVRDALTYQHVVEALKAAGYKARLDVEHSFQNRDGSVTVYLEPLTKQRRAGLVELLRGSGLYLDKNSGLANEYPPYAKDGADRDALYADKEVRGVVSVVTKPNADGTYDARIDLGGIELSFSPALTNRKGSELTFESAQVLANAIRKQAGKPELPIARAPEKLPTLAELEKAMPGFRRPPEPAAPEDVLKAVNRQFGPHGYHFKMDGGAVVSDRPLGGKDKEAFMSVLAAMPEEARLPFTAKHLNPDAPKADRTFRLTLDPGRVNKKQLDEFRRVTADEMDRLFEDERNTKPADREQSEFSADVMDAARDAVAFGATGAGEGRSSPPRAPGRKGRVSRRP
jgi:hypothetical protein